MIFKVPICCHHNFSGLSIFLLDWRSRVVLFQNAEGQIEFIYSVIPMLQGYSYFMIRNSLMINCKQIISRHKYDEYLIYMIKIASEKQILNYFQLAFGSHKTKYFGFYNSHFNQIITDQKYMVIPVDDRTATRAHGVFDVLYMKKNCIINMDQHIDRLYKSAESVCIKPPFDVEKAKNIIIEVTEKVIDYHLRNDVDGKNRNIIFQDSLCIRLTLSSGYGDFSVASLGKESILYIMIFEPYIPYEKIKLGVDQFVTKIVKQPKTLVHSKTMDYLENAIMANQSKIKGGYQGIKALQNGVLLEAASANIGFVFKRQFATPRFETVIEGTTIKKSLLFIETLKQEGLIETISFRDITIEQAQSADEMIVFGGDKIVPVLNFNGKKISQKRGPIALKIQQWYQKMNQKGTVVKISQDLL